MAEINDLPPQFDNEDDVLEEFAGLNVRPFMQSTVVAAEYNNEFFDPSQGNPTYGVSVLDDDAIIQRWDPLSLSIADGSISPADILSIIEIAANAKSTISNSKLLSWQVRPAEMTLGTSQLSSTRLMNSKIASGLGKQYIIDDDYTLVKDNEIDGEAPPSDDDSNSIKVRAAGYICLCLMRLMKKDPANFMKGIASIRRGFSLFYEQASSTVMSLEIPKATVIAISDGLRSNIKLGQTMIYHVATGMVGLDRTSQDYHLMRFTFCQHTELKGLHAYKLFYELDKVFNDRLPTPVFLSWLTNDTTHKAVMMIADIIRKYDNQEKTNEYLWLYARYLNNGYFYDLHTARCRWLVCVLGHLHKAQIPNVNATQGGPLDLLELKKMSKAEWTTAKEYAEIFEEQYTKQTAASAKMNRIQREFQRRKGIAITQGVKRKRSDDTTRMDTEENFNPKSPAVAPGQTSHPQKRKHPGETAHPDDDNENMEEEEGSDGEAPPIV